MRTIKWRAKPGLCSQFTAHYTAYTDFWLQPQLIKQEDILPMKLTIRNCWDMVGLKACIGEQNLMECFNNECSFTRSPPVSSYPYLVGAAYQIYHCSIKKINLRTKNKDD